MKSKNLPGFSNPFALHVAGVIHLIFIFPSFVMSKPAPPIPHLPKPIWNIVLESIADTYSVCLWIRSNTIDADADSASNGAFLMRVLAHMKIEGKTQILQYLCLYDMVVCRICSVYSLVQCTGRVDLLQVLMSQSRWKLQKECFFVDDVTCITNEAEPVKWLNALERGRCGVALPQGRVDGCHPIRRHVLPA